MSYDWSKLDRYSLADYIFLLKDELTNKQISIDFFHKKIKNHLKKVIPLIIRKKVNPKLKENEIEIGACYYYNLDQQHKTSIALDFFYSDKTDNIFLKNNYFLKTCYLIADNVFHEIIHMKQYRMRNFKFSKDYKSSSNNYDKKMSQEYLGNRDEIDAYAFNFACELYDYFWEDTDKILNILDDLENNRNKKYGLGVYIKNFKNDKKILEILKKKIIKYIPAAKRGRPYKRCNIISR
jgi:hypothetical protein